MPSMREPPCCRLGIAAAKRVEIIIGCCTHRPVREE